MPNKSTQKKRTPAQAQKKPAAKKTSRGTTAKNPSKTAEKMKQMKIKEKERNAVAKSFFVSQILPYVLIVAAIFLVVCYITGSGSNAGAVTEFIYNVLTGLFSGAAFILPVFLIVSAVMSLADKTDSSDVLRYTFAGISLFSSRHCSSL